MKRNEEIAMNYKQAIVSMALNMHNERTLKRIYKFVAYLYTHDTDNQLLEQSN